MKEITKNLKGEELKKLFSLLNEKSNKISIERYCYEKIPEEEFKKVQEEFKDYILESYKSRRTLYKEDESYREELRELLIAKTEQEANEYFNSLLEQDLEVMDSVNNDGIIKDIKKIEKEVISKKYTRATEVIVGPLMEQYYLEKGELLRNIENGMKCLFDFPYIINNEKYENLCFYRDDKCIFYICSHEKYAGFV